MKSSGSNQENTDKQNSALRQSSKGNSMEKKSNLPIPKGKENSIPRLVAGGPIIRKSRLSNEARPITGSLSANSSPLQSFPVIMSAAASVSAGSASAGTASAVSVVSSVTSSTPSVIMSSGSSQLTVSSHRLSASQSRMTTSLSANSSPLQLHPLVLNSGSSVGQGQGGSLTPSSGITSSVQKSVIVNNSTPLNSIPRVTGLPEHKLSSSSQSNILINNIIERGGLSDSGAIRSVIASAQNSPGTMTLAMNSKAHTPETITLEKFINSPGGSLHTPTLGGSLHTPTPGSVSTPTFMSSGGPRLSVPWNTPATDYKNSPTIGVQYTLSPATRTHYTTSYTLSSQELTNKLISYEHKQNGGNPADTSPKSNALYLTSNKVPDIHNIILAKMKHNRRRAKQKRAMMQSPVVAPSPRKPELRKVELEDTTDNEDVEFDVDDLHEEEDLEEVFQGEGECGSSVGSVASSRSTSRCNSQDERFTDEALETNFRALFQEVDFCRSGTVSSQRLLSRIMELMCCGSEEKWKIDEFSRLIDPRHDDRFVDVEQFVQLGKKWIENMLEHGEEMSDDQRSNGDDLTFTARKMARSWSQDNNQVLEEYNYTDEIEELKFNRSMNASFSGGGAGGRRDLLADASFGSVEGYGNGGEPGCYSKEVELENRCSELRYQLYRQQEEYQDLRRTLASTEDMTGHLSSQLDSAKTKISNLTAELDRVNCSSHDAEESLVAGRQAQNKCRSLALELEQLKDALSFKDSQLMDKDEKLRKLRQDVEASIDKERLAAIQLLHREAEIEALTGQLQNGLNRLEEVGQAMVNLEVEKEKSDDKVSKLQQEIKNKEIEIKEMKNLSQGLAVLGNQSVHIHGSNILDVSVDDKVFEDISQSSGGSPTPNKGRFVGLGDSPRGVGDSPRGPSASSTPNRSRKGSIVDELKEAVGSSSNNFPSPLCGKGGTLVNKLQRDMVKWEEGLRRVVIEEAPSVCTGKLVSALNKTMQTVRKDVIAKVEAYEEEVWEKEEDIKRKMEDLKLELDSANQQINNQDRITEDEKELELVESRLTEMAQLLNTANKALLATTNSNQLDQDQGGRKTPGSAEQSYDVDEDLLSNWNLDLDGLELVEWNNNLSRKLILCTKQIREDKRAGTPGSKLWLSILHSRLDELHQETEKSRDLLLFAEESIREEMNTTKEMNYANNEEYDAPTNITKEEERVLTLTEFESRGIQTSFGLDYELNSQLRAPSFPKTQSCQTSLVQHSQDNSQDNQTKTGNQKSAADGGPNGSSRGSSRSMWSWVLNLVSRLGSSSQNNNTVCQNSTNMVEEMPLYENQILHSTSLNNSTSTTSTTSLKNTTSSTSSVNSLPLMNHPLCQSLSFHSDNSTTPSSNQDVHNAPNKPVHSEQLQGELEFAVDSNINSSDNINDNITDSSLLNATKSIKSNCSIPNLTYNGEDSIFPPDSTSKISRYSVEISTGSPDLSAGQNRRYRIQSCDIIESGSWIICESIL